MPPLQVRVQQRSHCLHQVRFFLRLTSQMAGRPELDAGFFHARTGLPTLRFAQCGQTLPGLDHTSYGPVRALWPRLPVARAPTRLVLNKTPDPRTGCQTSGGQTLASGPDESAYDPGTKSIANALRDDLGAGDRHNGSLGSLLRSVQVMPR